MEEIPGGRGIGFGLVAGMAAMTALVGVVQVLLVTPLVLGDYPYVFPVFLVIAWAFAFLFALPSAAGAAALLDGWVKAARSPVLAAVAFWASMAAAWAVAIASAWPRHPEFWAALAADVCGAILYGLAAWLATRKAGVGALGMVWAFVAIALPSVVLGFAGGWGAVADLAGLLYVVLAGRSVYVAMRRPARPAAVRIVQVLRQPVGAPSVGKLIEVRASPAAGRSAASCWRRPGRR